MKLDRIYTDQVAPCTCLIKWKASRAIPLPLGLLGVLEGLHNLDDLLKCGNFLLQLGGDLGLILTELLVEVGAVWGGGHGGGEEGLDDERVVRLEGLTIGVTEGVRELLGGVLDVVAECLHSEVKATGSIQVSHSSPRLAQTGVVSQLTFSKCS